MGLAGRSNHPGLAEATAGGQLPLGAMPNSTALGCEGLAQLISLLHVATMDKGTE